MSVKRGKFITFEGCDGSGKSTQIKLITRWLTEAGYDVLTVREPGGTRIGEMIRGLLLNPENAEMSNMTEMLLYAAARAQLASEVIESALARGSIVVCDRWADSSIVYQGVARGLGEDVKIVNTRAAGKLFSPDVTILLDLDPNEALARAANIKVEGKKYLRLGEDRIEALGISFQARVRAAYLELAAKEPDRIHVIDAAGNPEEVQGRVRDALAGALADVPGNGAGV